MATNLIPVIFDDFSGGINTTVSITGLKPNELEDGLNVYPYSRGSVRKAYGYAKVNSSESASATNPYQGLYEFREKDGTVWWIKVRGASIFVSDDRGETWEDKTGSLSLTAGANYQWKFVDMLDKVFAVNGTDGIIYWTGSGDFQQFTGTNVPSDAKELFVWQNRLWFVATTESGTFYPMRVRGSANGDPIDFSDADAFIDIDGAFGGREIVRVYPDYNNNAYCFCSPTGVYYLTWDATADTWSGKLTVKTVTQGWGVAAGRSVDLIGNIFVFYANDNRIRGWDHRDLTRARLIELSGKDDRFYDYVRYDRAPYFIGMSIPELRQYWLACTYDPEGNLEYNNFVHAVQLYGDIRVDDDEAEDKFTCWRFNRLINCMGRFQESTGGWKVLSGTHDGILHQQNTGDNYDSGIIPAYMVTALNDGGAPGQEKAWRAIHVYTRAIGAFDVAVSVQDERGYEMKMDEITLGKPAAKFDIDTWDNAVWDGGGVSRRSFSIDHRSESIKVRLTNTQADQPFEVLKIIAYYNDPRPLAVGVSTDFD